MVRVPDKLRAKYIEPPPAEPPSIALASYPRSGNTWLRALLETATGTESGSRYGDGDPFLKRSKVGCVIKTHERECYTFDGAIHLVRHPYDCMWSYYCFQQDFGNGGGCQLPWDEYVHLEALRWRDHTRHWLDAPYQTLVVRYEDLRDKPLITLSACVAYLGREVAPEYLQAAFDECSLERMRKRHQKDDKRPSEKFFREGKSGGGFDRFNVDNCQVLKTALKDIVGHFRYELRG